MKEDIHQTLMNQVYNLWQQHTDWSQTTLFLNCTGLQKIAVLLGNLNYQVYNGGFSQWCCNGYCLQAKEVQAALTMVGTESCLKAANMVGKFIPHINFNANNAGCMGDYIKGSRVSKIVKTDTPDDLDDQFYLIGDQLMKDVESYLAERYLAKDLQNATR